MSPEVPEISICIITYNHELFITDAIKSILKQDISVPYEIIIGDDCSSDKTRQLCSDLAEEYPSVITLLPKENNLGITGNFFRTLAHCRGRYIAVCEGDDFWTDGQKLSKQYTFLEGNSDFGLVYTDIEIKNTSATAISWPQYFSGEIFDKLLSGNFINTLTVLFRKDLISIGEINKEQLTYAYDHFYWLRIAASSKIHFMPERSACYRIHGNNYSLTERNSSQKARRKSYPEFLLDAIHYYLDQNDHVLKIRVNKKLMFRKYLFGLLNSRKSISEVRYLWLMLKILSRKG